MKVFPALASNPLLEVKELTCERDDRILFSGLSFSVNSGETIQIEGSNGSGKTSLLRILCGISNHFDGELFWQGQPIETVREEFLASTLYVGHQPGVKLTLTPEENLRWYQALEGLNDFHAVDRALEKVGLAGYEDVPCHTLSAGQQRRVALARLHMTLAILWILDEPFVAIDKKGVAEQESLIAAHVNKGGSVVVTTHQLLTLPHQVRRISLDKNELRGRKSA